MKHGTALHLVNGNQIEFYMYTSACDRDWEIGECISMRSHYITAAQSGDEFLCNSSDCLHIERRWTKKIERKKKKKMQKTTKIETLRCIQYSNYIHRANESLFSLQFTVVNRVRQELWSQVKNIYQITLAYRCSEPQKKSIPLVEIYAVFVFLHSIPLCCPTV